MCSCLWAPFWTRLHFLTITFRLTRRRRRGGHGRRHGTDGRGWCWCSSASSVLHCLTSVSRATVSPKMRHRGAYSVILDRPQASNEDVKHPQMNFLTAKTIIVIEIMRRTSLLLHNSWLALNWGYCRDNRNQKSPNNRDLHNTQTTCAAATT